MDTQQLTQGLKQALFVENHRIVFWYDADQSFADELPLLDLPNVHVLNMQGESTFGLKLKLELEDTQAKYLLYFPCAEPEADDDWLLDIKLYSRTPPEIEEVHAMDELFKKIEYPALLHCKSGADRAGKDDLVVAHPGVSRLQPRQDGRRAACPECV